MSSNAERILVRVLVGAGLCVAGLASVLAPVPEDATGRSTLPAIALDQVGLYRMEKFAEEVNQSGEAAETAVKELELSVGALAEELKQAMTELDRIKKRGDGT